MAEDEVDVLDNKAVGLCLEKINNHVIKMRLAVKRGKHYAMTTLSRKMAKIRCEETRNEARKLIKQRQLSRMEEETKIIKSLNCDMIALYALEHCPDEDLCKLLGSDPPIERRAKARVAHTKGVLAAVGALASAFPKYRSYVTLYAARKEKGVGAKKHMKGKPKTAQLKSPRDCDPPKTIGKLSRETSCDEKEKNAKEKINKICDSIQRLEQVSQPDDETIKNAPVMFSEKLDNLNDDDNVVITNNEDSLTEDKDSQLSVSDASGSSRMRTDDAVEVDNLKSLPAGGVMVVTRLNLDDLDETDQVKLPDHVAMLDEENEDESISATHSDDPFFAGSNARPKRKISDDAHSDDDDDVSKDSDDPNGFELMSTFVGLSEGTNKQGRRKTFCGRDSRGRGTNFKGPRSQGAWSQPDEEKTKHFNVNMNRGNARSSSTRGKFDRGRGSQNGSTVSVKNLSLPKMDINSLHPSWRAKRQEKLQIGAVTASQGKKITFD